MQRLSEMLRLDRQYVSEQMLKLLESEIERTIKNFVNLSSSVKARYCKSGDGLKFMIEFNAQSVKQLGFVP